MYGAAIRFCYTLRINVYSVLGVHIDTKGVKWTTEHDWINKQRMEIDSNTSVSEIRQQIQTQHCIDLGWLA